jgi:peptidoglycan lytic transglycosylase G
VKAERSPQSLVPSPQRGQRRFEPWRRAPGTYGLGTGDWGLGTLLLLLACSAPSPDAKLERVVIPPGSGFHTVTDSVAAHGLISSRFWFRVLARLRGADRAVKAGIYDLPSGANAWSLIDILEAGRVATARFTAPEGLTLLELASQVEERLGIPADTLLARARDSQFREELGISAPSLEGYLLPETYTLPLPITADDLLRAMTAGFKRHWLPEWSRRLDSLGMTRNQLLALASIVEGEARHDDERAVIAGVYSNRLRLGMLLQADPTVQYAIQMTKGARKPRLWFKDLEIQSPYNTYLHVGLPPGPVNSPGIKSIEAALYPASVPWLYFVAGPDGHHVFTRTLVEHNRAIEEVRRAERQGK